MNKKAWPPDALVVFSSQVVPTPCNPVDCSKPGFLVLHYLPEFTQIHVHWVSGAIQLSHPLLPPSPPALNHSHHQIFSSELALCIRWPKYWSFSFSISPFNEYSGLIFLRLVWSPCSSRDSQDYSPVPQFESFSSLALNRLYNPSKRPETKIHSNITLSPASPAMQANSLWLNCPESPWKKCKRYVNPEKEELNFVLKIKCFLKKTMLRLILKDEEKLQTWQEGKKVYIILRKQNI